jgi:hypothetical protein
MMMMMMCCWDPFVGVGASESGPPSMFRAGSLCGGVDFLPVVAVVCWLAAGVVRLETFLCFFW